MTSSQTMSTSVKSPSGKTETTSIPPTETLGDWMDRGLNEEKPTEQELMDDWGGLDS